VIVVVVVVVAFTYNEQVCQSAGMSVCMGIKGGWSVYLSEGRV